VNNKTYLATKVSLFIANYGRELRMKADIRRKGKVEKVIEFAERIKKVQEKAGVALRKIYIMVCLDTNIFPFLLSIFLDFIFLFF